MEVTTIATTAQEGVYGPQLGPGVTFASFGSPQLNANGQVAFQGSLLGTTTSNDQGIWLADAGRIRPIARVGTDGLLGSGEGSGVTFTRYNLGSVTLNNAGQVAFSAVIERSPDYQGLWLNSGVGNINKAIVRSDGPLGPNLGAGIEFTPSLSVSGLSDAGEIVFRGNVNQTDPVAGGQAGIWRIGSVGGPQPLARVGTTGPLGPGLGDGRIFETFDQLSLDRAGRVLVSARLKDAETASDPYAPVTFSLLRLSSDGNTPLWMSDTDGRYGPQLGAGVSFDHSFGNALGAAGEVATIATIQGPGIDSSNNGGIWRVTDDAIAPVARDGTDSVLGPGLGSGVIFNTYDAGPNGNGTGFANVSTYDGSVAFLAGLAGISGVGDNPVRGVFLNDSAGDVNTAIALTRTSGDLGPNLGGGEVFVGFYSLDITADGTTFFRAHDMVEGATTTTSGFWAYSDGELVKLLRSGDMVDGRTIGGFMGVDVDPISNTALAHVIFKEGGSSLLLVSVPEPTSTAALLMASGFLCRRRPRHSAGR